MSVTTRRGRWAGTLLTLGLWACNLVGYDELADSTLAEGGAIPDPDRTQPVDEAGQGVVREAGAADGATATDAAHEDGHADTQVGGDAQVDATTGASTLEDGWWSGITPSTPCSAGQSCYPDCATKWDRCVIDCTDASECEPKCLPETACKVDCGNTEDCNLSCKHDSLCWFDCAAADSCSAYCAEGSTCQVDCTSAGSCDVLCLAGASCDVDCTGDADCSDYVCSSGAQCLMHCGDDGCDFDCHGTGLSCPDNHEVCNRACP